MKDHVFLAQAWLLNTVVLNKHAALLPLADIIAPILNVEVEGDPVAGQAFTLVCRITLPDGLSTEPQISWLSPQGDVLTSEGELTVGSQPVLGNPSRLVTYVTQFSPLLTSHGGTYTCQVTVSSPHGTIQPSSSMAQEVTVASMFNLLY